MTEIITISYDGEEVETLIEPTIFSMFKEEHKKAMEECIRTAMEIVKQVVNS